MSSAKRSLSEPSTRRRSNRGRGRGATRSQRNASRSGGKSAPQHCWALVVEGLKGFARDLRALNHHDHMFETLIRYSIVHSNSINEANTFDRRGGHVVAISAFIDAARVPIDGRPLVNPLLPDYCDSAKDFHALLMSDDVILRALNLGDDDCIDELGRRFDLLRFHCGGFVCLKRVKWRVDGVQHVRLDRFKPLFDQCFDGARRGCRRSHWYVPLRAASAAAGDQQPAVCALCDGALSAPANVKRYQVTDASFAVWQRDDDASGRVLRWAVDNGRGGFVSFGGTRMLGTDKTFVDTAVRELAEEMFFVFGGNRDECKRNGALFAPVIEAVERARRLFHRVVFGDDDDNDDGDDNDVAWIRKHTGFVLRRLASSARTVAVFNMSVHTFERMLGIDNVWQRYFVRRASGIDFDSRHYLALLGDDDDDKKFRDAKAMHDRNAPWVTGTTFRRLAIDPEGEITNDAEPTFVYNYNAELRQLLKKDVNGARVEWLKLIAIMFGSSDSRAKVASSSSAI
jgi:hypothetical protein